MSNQKYSKVNTSVLLQEAKIAIRDTVDVLGNKLHELEPAQWCGRRALVLDEKERGITVAIRIELPETSSLRNGSAASAESLTLLGALTFSLQEHDAHAKLLSGNEGLEAIMVSRHLCEREIDSATLSHHLNQIQDVVQSIEPVLSLTGPSLIETVIERVRPVISAPTEETLKVEPVIVPTFDEEARDRMMRQMRQ